MEKKVSIIVPVYKVEPYIHRCIDSIINQTYKNLEIILVDDESPDSSGEICDQYARKDDRIIVIHKKNGGSSSARNSGLDIATGEYIAYVDSDDYIDVTMIEKMMHYVIKHDLELIEISHKNADKGRVFDNTFKIEDPVAATKRILSTTAFSVWRRIFKKSLVDDMRFIPGIIHQDVFYTIDTLKRITKSGFLNTPLYYYNSDNISITRSNYSLEKIETGIRATEYIVNNVIKDPSIQPNLDRYLTNYYTDHYFLLSRNIAIDPNKKFRKKLKKTIRKSLNFQNASIRSIMVVFLPSKLMEIISSFRKN